MDNTMKATEKLCEVMGLPITDSNLRSFSSVLQVAVECGYQQAMYNLYPMSLHDICDVVVESGDKTMKEYLTENRKRMGTIGYDVMRQYFE